MKFFSRHALTILYLLMTIFGIAKSVVVGDFTAVNFIACCVCSFISGVFLVYDIFLTCGGDDEHLS